jgi:uncharacterized protein (TIGR02001 family)
LKFAVFSNLKKEAPMKKMPKAILLVGVIGLTINAGFARAQSADNSLTGKAAFYSEYEYRGISQTSEKPAVQLNLDYAHKSGLYLGTFVTNIKWLKDTAQENGFSSSSNIEWDLYGGYKFEPVKNVVLDLGYLHYEYPSSSAFSPKPNTDEVYVGASYGPVTLKYSYSVNDTFGVRNSKGSDYVELSANVPVPGLPQLTVNGLVGRQKYKNNDFLSYNVYKLGATWDFGHGVNAGAYLKSTDAERVWYTIKGKDWSKDRAVAFVAYSF